MPFASGCCGLGAANEGIFSIFGGMCAQNEYHCQNGDVSGNGRQFDFSEISRQDSGFGQILTVNRSRVRKLRCRLLRAVVVSVVPGKEFFRFSGGWMLKMSNLARMAP